MQTFQASCLRDALARVRHEMGPDAVILGTRYLDPQGVGALVQRSRVEITAAPGDHRASPAAHAAQRLRDSAAARGGPTALAAGRVPGDLRPLYNALLQNELDDALATRLVERVAATPAAQRAGDQAWERLRDVLAELIRTTPGIRLEPGETRRVALVGPPGAGKTTTLAKLAALFRLREHRSVGLLSLDAFRLGTHEQLSRYAELIDVPMRSAQSGDEVRAALDSFGALDVLLLDTPGIAHKDAARRARLGSLLHAAKPDEVHLVLPADRNARLLEQVCRTFGPLGVSRVVLSRLDETEGCANLLRMLERLPWEVAYTCDGQNVPRDVQPACPRQIARLLFPTTKAG